MNGMNGLAVINSRDCPSNQAAGSARYSLDANVRGFTSLSLVEYELVLDVPHINSTNNVAVIDTGTQSYPVEIASGSYDTETLRVAFETQLNTLGLGAFTVALDAGLLRYTITAPVPVRIATNPILVGAWDFTRMMGFPQGAPLSATITGGLIDLTWTTSIFVISREAHRQIKKRDITSDGRAGDILAVVPLREDDTSPATQDFGKGVYAGRIETPKHVPYSPNVSLANLDIVLLDDRGNRIPEDKPATSGAPPVVSYRFVLHTT